MTREIFTLKCIIKSRETMDYLLYGGNQTTDEDRIEFLTTIIEKALGAEGLLTEIFIDKEEDETKM